MIGNKVAGCEPKIERPREVDCATEMLENSVQELQKSFAELEYRLSVVLPNQETEPKEAPPKISFNMHLADKISQQASAIMEMQLACDYWVKKIGI